MQTKTLKQKFTDLKDIIKELESVVVAFSGGVDSTFLLDIAVEVLGKENVLAVTSSAETYPSEELEDAKQFVKEIGAEHHITYTSELENSNFTQNDKNRCYYCKKELFSDLKKIAEEKGYKYVLDGSNYDDKVNDYRPGLQAAAELNIKSPLKKAEMTKDNIRKISKIRGLPTWNKPSFACLSSRFPYGDKIDIYKLNMVDKGEAFLREFDFNQLRLRHHDENTARIEVLVEDIPELLKHRKKIVTKLKDIGYTYITLDIEGYRTGSMNEVLDEND